MSPFRNLPIKWKLTLTSLVPVTVVLVLAGAGVITEELLTFHPAAVSRASALAAVVSHNYGPVLLFGDRGAAKADLDALLAHREVTGGAFYTRDGKLFARNSRGNESMPESLPLPLVGADVFEGDSLSVIRLIQSDNETVGAIYLRLNLTEQRQHVNFYVSMVGLIAAALLAVALLLAALLQRAVSNPILALAEVAERVTRRHDYSARAAAQTRDELGSLVGAFNEMLAQIQQRDASLRESEERFRIAFEEGPLGIALVGPDFRYLKANRALCEMLGYTEAELQGRPFEEITHPDDLARDHELTKKIFSGELSRYTLEKRYLTKNGEASWVNLSARIIRDGEGRPVFGLAVIENINERKRAEARLRESEERFRQLAEHIGEVFWVTNPEKTQTLYVSPGYEKIWGRTCESLYASPRNWLEAIHPDDRERVLKAAVEKQASGDYEEVYRIVRADGALRWIRDRAFPVRDESGKVQRIVGIAEDITTLRQVEEAARENEAQIRAIVNSALDGILTLDRAGRVLEFNLAAEKIFGCSRAMIIGKDLSATLIAPSLFYWFQRGLAGQFATDEGPILDCRMEMNARRVDGSEFPAEFTITRFELRGRSLFTVFIRDITRRKQAEAQIATLVHAAESTAEMICITDLEDRFTFANRAFLKTYGYAREEILGKTPEMLLSPSNPPSLLSEILEKTRSGGWRGEVLDRRKDGSEFPILLSTSIITNHSGERLGLMGVAQDITERKQAEEQVRLLGDAVQSAQEMISITDAGNRLIFVNQAFAKAYGYSIEDILGRTPDFLRAPTVSPGLNEEIFRQTCAGGWRGELLNRRKDGTVFPISLSTSPIKDKDGRMLGLVGLARDISERRRLERQTAVFAALGYRLSGVATPEQAATIILEVASELFGWDAGYVHLYSEADDRIIPVLTFDTVEGERRSVPPASFTLDPSPLMRRVMQEGDQLVNRTDKAPPPSNLIPFGDAQRPSASMMYVPIRTERSVLGILSVQSYTPHAYGRGDLTVLRALADHCGEALERIRVAEALRVAEANYRGIFESATEGIFRTTSDGRYLTANPALARMFGYESPEELISSVTNIERQTFVSAENAVELKRLLETQDYAQGFEAERYRKDGSRYWTSINVRAQRDANGKLLHYEGTVQDITDRKKIEQRRAAFSMLGQSLSATSTPKEAAQIIVATADELLGWDACYVHLYAPERDEILPVLAMDTIQGRRVEVSADSFTLNPSPIMRLVMEHGAQLINRDGGDSVEFPLRAFGDATRRSASMMYARVRKADKVLGILSIQSYRPQAYTPDDLRLLESLASLCGGSIERIRLTESLRENEQRFRALFESAPIGIALHDASGRIIETNRRYEALTGYSGEELRKLGIKRITHPDDVADGQRLYRELCDRKRDRYQREKRYLHKDGHVIWGQSSVSAIRDASGALMYLISMVEDISERKRILEALRESERNLRLIAENTTDVIFAFDMNRRPLYVNSAVETLTGYSFAEIEKSGFINWIHPDDQERMMKHWEELYQGKAYADVEFRLIGKSGKMKWCSSTWGPLLDEHGRQIGVQGRERDITQHKQLEREVLESAANERRRIGHDLHDGLGQHLAGIALKTKALEESLIAEESKEARVAKQLVGLMNQAIGQTRNLAHGLDPVHVEADGLVAALGKLAAQSSELSGVKCIFGCGQKRLAVSAQAGLELYRIAQEAIHNAVKHGRARRIEIELDMDAAHLRLSIRDDGKGFDAQAASTAGMGSHIMRYRANSLQGRLTIHSQPAKGTHVECLVPKQFCLARVGRTVVRE